MILFSSLENIINGTNLQLAQDRPITDLVIDSRKAIVSEQTLFFCITGLRNDGHDFINELYHKGIRQFVVERAIGFQLYPEANFIQVDYATRALQHLAAYHRSEFNIPVVGITGSNGKTIVKEWLFQLLSPDYSIVKNPGSYNSQVGVPLSVWQMNSHHQFGLFEAGISLPHEMEYLANIIKPTIGIFTNVGSAHQEGFASYEEKAKEKMKLFEGASILIYCTEHKIIHDLAKHCNASVVSWGHKENASLKIENHLDGKYTLNWKQKQVELTLPFSDTASIENCFHCVTLMLHLGYSMPTIQRRIDTLKSVPMRLELKQGINNCQLIDDSYNNDLGGLRISLDFLGSINKKRKTLILSDILQSGLNESELIARIVDLISKSKITRFIGIGHVLTAYSNSFIQLPVATSFFTNTADAIRNLASLNFHDEVILIKGARPFAFEKITASLQRKVHGTRMEIDLGKIVHNLNYFKSRLNPGVKIMVMVKAFAYGSGSEEVATLLQFHRVDYLGVAYADEGVDLRKNQIGLPVMVMNATEESYPNLLEYKLEPVMYSLKVLRSFSEFAKLQPCKVHLELDTGMKRLGIEENDLEEVLAVLKENPNLEVASVFSHLAGADESKHDNFTQTQVSKFNKMYALITQALSYNPIRHILNSPGILRHTQHQMDMVRLGIGLYGVNPTSDAFKELKPVASLKTIISQIKNIRQGETIGYGRRGVAEKDITIATIAIGYADGFSRVFSRGAGFVSIKGKRAPVIGNVCMDMTMIDITNIEAHEGDEVIIFGEDLPIHEVAERAQTIPYEILTNTSERVKRIFYTESV